MWTCVTVIPERWEVEAGGVQLEASLSKVSETLSQPMSLVCACNPSYVGPRDRRIRQRDPVSK
jgi:hypothetical protein